MTNCLRGLALVMAIFVAIGIAGNPGAIATPGSGEPEQPVIVKLTNATLRVHFSESAKKIPRKEILDWIKNSARAISIYYDRFPQTSTNIFIKSVAGRGVKSGRAFGGTNPYLRISVGLQSTNADFKRDWIMVHEMIHLAFPVLDDRHGWLTEGLAVYVESIARLQANDLDEETVWFEFVKGMQKGLPRSGDKGLDHTPTWGRTYWGGAIFCLVADLEIRKRTNGGKSLQDALQGVLNAGGNHAEYWTIRKALAVADEATGTTVLMDLYDAWRNTPVDPKLPALWQRLGVEVNGSSVKIDDSASLAAIRRQIGRRGGRSPVP